MTLLKDNNYKDINVALLSLEADIKNKITGFDTSEIDKQLAEINSRIDKINASGGNNSSDEIEDINSKLNINSTKIRNIKQNVEDINTQINGIEQKLSDIFSAENKVTDFNATTDSGIYYWYDDAANRPSDYGVLLVNKYDSGSESIWVNQVAYGTNKKIYFRQNINSGSWTEWKAVAFDGEITAKKVANALTVNGKTYDGSSAVNAGVQTVANGGTGATDAATAFNTLADGVRDAFSPADNEKMLLKQASATWYKTTCLDFWNYIKGKISSVLGLTKDNYGGKASTAGTADVANALAYRGGIENTDTFQNVMNDDGKWNITDLNSGWIGSLYSFHAGGSQSGLMFRIRGGSADIRNIEVNYSIDSNRFAGPWRALIGRIPIGAPSSPQDGDIWIS